MNDYLETEKKIFPEAWEIKRHYWNIDCEEPKKGEKRYLSHITTQVLDDDMDPVNVTINKGSVEINTEDYDYLLFSERQFEFIWDEYLNAQNEMIKSHKEMMKDEKKRDSENES